MKKKKWKGVASWIEELKAGDVTWEVELVVSSNGYPVKQNKVWVDPTDNQPVVVLSRKLKLNGKPVGMEWTLIEE